MLFGWETVMTFVLVSTVYAVAIGEPSFGVGLSLFAMVFAGKPPCLSIISICMHSIEFLSLQIGAYSSNAQP